MPVTLSDKQYVALRDLVGTLVAQLDEEFGPSLCDHHEKVDCTELCACGHPCSKHVSFGEWDEHDNREHDMCLEHGCKCFKYRSMVTACEKLVAEVLKPLCDHPLADGRKAGCVNEVKFVCDCKKCRREDPVCACEEHFATVTGHHRRIYQILPLWRVLGVK